VLLVVGRPGRIVYMVLITTTRAQRRRFRNGLLKFVMRCCRDCDWVRLAVLVWPALCLNRACARRCLLSGSCA
jgi:hypothetical protein